MVVCVHAPLRPTSPAPLGHLSAAGEQTSEERETKKRSKVGVIVRTKVMLGETD